MADTASSNIPNIPDETDGQPPRSRKPRRNEVSDMVRTQLEKRQLFNEQYDVYVPEVKIKPGPRIHFTDGGCETYSTIVSFRPLFR